MSLQFFECFQESVDMFFGMDGGNEGDFEAAGRGVEPVVEHVMEITGMGLLIARF
jgi:hypothetical protein